MRSTFKRRLLALGLILVSVGASVSFLGCEAINNAATLKIPISVNLSVVSTRPNIPTFDVGCADMTTNKDFMDNRDKVESGVVKSAQFQIVRLDNPIFTTGGIPDQSFTTCSFVLVFDERYEDSKEYNLGTFTNISLAELLAGPVNVPLNDDIKAAINLIPRRPIFCIKTVYGPMNTGPASATYMEGKITLDLDFSASAL